MVDFKSLETFVWVANLGSFRGAAAKLNTTQPAISQRIAGLEAAFGAKLVNRQPRAIRPTEKGRVLLDYATRILGLHAQMRAAIASGQALGGVLRLGVAETIVHTWLPRLIERVAQSHPRLALEIEVDISPNLRERLVAQKLDLAFLLGPLSAPSIRNRALGSFPLAFVASPRLKLPPGRIRLQDLAAWPIITFSRRTQPYIAIRELFADAEPATLRLHASASLAPVVRMAVDGIGIAAIPPAIVGEELRRRKLRIVPSDAVLPDLAFSASWPRTADDRAAHSVAALAVEVAAAYAAKND